MRWYQLCANPGVVETEFRDPPEIDHWSIYHVEFQNELFVLVSGTIPFTPDSVNGIDNRVPKNAELALSFNDISSIEMSCRPGGITGGLTLSERPNGSIEFEFQSEGFQFEGSCRNVTINYLSLTYEQTSNIRSSRGAQLFAFRNVWNTCLALMQDYGYDLRIVGSPDANGTVSKCEWTATQADGTKLTASNPIELLGLVSLHRHQSPTTNEEYWWRIEGPNLVNELIQNWREQNTPNDH